MLGKLWKHEWKSISKVGCILLICMAAVTLVGCFSLRMPFLYGTISEERNMSFGPLDIMGVMTMILYILALVGISYAILIYLGVHFYKNMYTDEGYLTHTLPVTVHQTLISKILAGVLWQFIIMLSIVVSIGVFVYTAVCLYVPTTPAELTQVIGEAISRLTEYIPAELSGSLTHLIVSVILILIVNPFNSIIVLYGSITLGQLFTKYRALMAIVCYIGITTVTGIVSSLVSMPLSMGFMLDSALPSDSVAKGRSMLNYYAGLYDMSVILALVSCAALYAVSYFVLTRKFDLE